MKVYKVSNDAFFEELLKLGVDQRVLPVFKAKGETLFFKLKGLDFKQLIILKQEALACGADAAIPKEALLGKGGDAILICNRAQLDRILDKLEKQDFSLPLISSAIKKLVEVKVNNFSGRNFSFNLENGPFIMGVLNVTPDSFYDGGKFFDVEKAVDRALQMVEEGAAIIDVGGESTRPGATPVSTQEEMARVLPVIEKLALKVNVPISIDTYKAEVAEAALKAGASMVNDISGGRFSKNMKDIVAKYGAGVVVQHIKGKPRNMQKNPQYQDLMAEITDYLRERTRSFEEAGVPSESIVIDPGIGFGKKFEHNFEIIRRIDELKALGYPVLVGHSRKSFIGSVTGAPPQERLEGSLAVAAVLVWKGVDFLRVHDVKETARVIKVVKALKGRK